ncbi:MAG TPA: hypothetical protein VMS31_21545 [Pyrinomonadaceae bacterium]|nr:hypothetical protein [Pyrinomonadaceae bacterium]
MQRSHVARGEHGEWYNYSRAELFDAAEQILQEVFPTYNVPIFIPGQRHSDTQSSPGHPSRAQQDILREFFAWYLFPYFKFFDAELTDDHRDNYYMEREWRVVGAVHFNAKDIRRILIPEAYRQRLRLDLPAYDGQVTFTT